MFSGASMTQSVADQDLADPSYGREGTHAVVIIKALAQDSRPARKAPIVERPPLKDDEGYNEA